MTCLSIRRAGKALALIAAFGLAAAAQQARAGCTVSSTGLAFGTYQSLTVAGKLTSTDSTSNASVSVACSGIASLGSFSIALGPSAVGPGDRISNRYLPNSNGGADMRFNVYTNPTYSTVWGNGTTGSVLSGNIPITVGSSNQTVTIYGKIPSGQNTLKAGSFSGPLTMTMTYMP